MTERIAYKATSSEWIVFLSFTLADVVVYLALRYTKCTCLADTSEAILIVYKGSLKNRTLYIWVAQCV